MFPCRAKLRDVCTGNSVQSTTHRIFLIVLNTFGRYLNITHLGGNITSSISLNTLYINCINVVKILLIVVLSIHLAGELKSIAIVLKVKPLLSRTRQIKSFSRLDIFFSGPYFLVVCSACDCFALDVVYTMLSNGQTLSRNEYSFKLFSFQPSKTLHRRRRFTNVFVRQTRYYIYIVRRLCSIDFVSQQYRFNFSRQLVLRVISLSFLICYCRSKST